MSPVQGVRDQEADPRTMSSAARREFGVTISFLADDGKRLTLHHTGPIRAAVRSACAVALAKDESYRVVSCSTPTSIFTDIQGSRRHPNALGCVTGLPEQTLLGQAGLAPLLHPSVARWPK